MKFKVYNDGEYWCTSGIGVDIFMQGETLGEVTKNMKEAADVHLG